MSIRKENLKPQNFTVADRATSDKKVYYSRCLSEDTRGRFKAEIMALLPLAPCTDAKNHIDLNVTPSGIDYFLNDTAATLRTGFTV